ncbi:perforin-1 isoform X1 [Oreochromis niloticus]|uniref:perforin-1 isoform X1 n=2 Tax=Oreochromis niloticus TaxID=8128 RepID=UPI0009053D96|nr:perforin-1 isoform X1 [Oreochromis niloticus]
MTCQSLICNPTCAGSAMRSSPTSPPLYLSLLLFLSWNSPVLSCKAVNNSKCESAPFVPGHNLIGEGFDVITMRRKGAYMIDVATYRKPDGTCTLCINRHQNKTVQKLPASVLDWRAISRCNADIFSSAHTTVSSLLNTYTAQDINDWKVGLSINKNVSTTVGMGGTHSTAYAFASKRTREDHYSFSTHTVTCSHYRYRVSSTPILSSEFSRDVASLPSHYNSSTRAQYNEVIDTYGTHYIRQVHLGGRLRRVTAVRTCLSRLNGFSLDEFHSCLSMGVSIGLGKLNPSSVAQSCKNMLGNRDVATKYSSGLHQHYTDVVGGNGWLGEFSLAYDDSLDFKNWLNSLRDHPDVASYFLRPMYQLIPKGTKKAGMKAAIEQYITDNTVHTSHSEHNCWRGNPNLDFNCCPRNAWRGKLTVEITRAWNLEGDYVGPTDSYAKVKFGSIIKQTRMIESDYPRWNAYFNLGQVDTHTDVYVELWDEDMYYDDLLGSCSQRPTQGTHIFSCSADSGGYEFKTTLTCDSHLTGDWCHQYTPSP